MKIIITILAAMAVINAAIAYACCVVADSAAYVDFTQGLDVRLTTPENIDLLNRMRIKRLHFAWDNPFQSTHPLRGATATEEQIKKHGFELAGWCVECEKPIEGRWIGMANFCPWCGRVIKWIDDPKKEDCHERI